MMTMADGHITTPLLAIIITITPSLNKLKLASKCNEVVWLNCLAILDENIRLLYSDYANSKPTTAK